MTNEKLCFKPVTSLLNEKFNIPSYQRGYRWTETQVKNLLDDIWNFRIDSEDKSKEVFYCLQPVVVSKKVDEWELIDGQQRLTTIYLILYFLRDVLTILGKNNFSIRYQTRPDSEIFLKNIDINFQEQSIDHFHMYQALKTIEDWFNKKDGTAKINFLTTLLNNNESGKNVQFIWYDISDENTNVGFATDVFTRLNIGKIPLTNAELIRALFLSKSAYGKDAESKYLKQINIASEWDRIEQTLQNPDFWHFICNRPEKYITRIEYIFDIIKDKKTDYENYYTFYKFSKEFENNKQNPRVIDDIWLNIKNHFLTFEEWFHDRELFHLIGYLITIGKNVSEILIISNGIGKTAFRNDLIKLVKDSISLEDIDNFDYNYHKTEIRKTLLLFNILSILENPYSSIRFPFHQYYIQHWDIEHVRSQTSKDIQGKDRLNWIDTLIEYFSGLEWLPENEKSISQNITLLPEEEKAFCHSLFSLKKDEKMDDHKFFKIYETLKTYFKEDKQFDSTDGIGNLVLLDEGTNRKYKNAFFPVKRKYIIQKEKQGVFIPLCTKNVFLKAYSKKLGEVMYWNNNDSSDYLTELKNVLNHA